MIQGNFDSNGKLFFPIDLIASDGETIPADALLDTGFTQWLAMNNQDIQSLGWLLLEEKLMMQTAQGESDFDVYAGTAIVDGQSFEIPVLGGDAITDILLGLPWLRTRRLLVDFPEGILTLG